MKFVVDAQLPKSLSDFLKTKGFDSIHTLDLPDRNATKDSQINKLALQEHRIVISKDKDFLESFLLRREPPQLILVKTGNIPNPHLIEIFGVNLKTIEGMLSRSSLVEIGRSDIVEKD